jgi:hypothetical protein
MLVTQGPPLPRRAEMEQESAWRRAWGQHWRTASDRTYVRCRARWSEGIWMARIGSRGAMTSWAVVGMIVVALHPHRGNVRPRGTDLQSIARWASHGLWARRSRICSGNASPGNDLGKCRFDCAAPGVDLLLATTARFDPTKAHRNLPSDYPRRAGARRATVWHGSAHRLQAHLPMPTLADGSGSARPPAG